MVAPTDGMGVYGETKDPKGGTGSCNMLLAPQGGWVAIGPVPPPNHHHACVSVKGPAAVFISRVLKA